LLAIGIWNECDDMGAFEWKPVTLKIRILPVDSTDVVQLLAELSSANIIARYIVDGREYGAVRNFGRFQRPKKPRSTLPIPSEWRKYAASDAVSPEPEADEAGAGSPPPAVEPRPVPKKAELALVQPTRVPRKSENGPQMEEEGGYGGGTRKTRKNPPHKPPPRAGGRVMRGRQRGGAVNGPAEALDQMLAERDDA
jgi:hypothetical protein